jgi:hypothetical protein
VNETWGPRMDGSVGIIFLAAETRDPDKGSQQKTGETLSCSSHQLPQFHFSIHDSLPFPHLFLCYHHLPHSNLRKVTPFCSFLLEFFLASSSLLHRPRISSPVIRGSFHFGRCLFEANWREGKGGLCFLGASAFLGE